MSRSRTVGGWVDREALDLRTGDEIRHSSWNNEDLSDGYNYIIVSEDPFDRSKIWTDYKRVIERRPEGNEYKRHMFSSECTEEDHWYYVTVGNGKKVRSKSGFGKFLSRIEGGDLERIEDGTS